VHIFLAFYVFASCLHNSDLYASFGFSARPTLMGLFLFFSALWSPIDKVLCVYVGGGVVGQCAWYRGRHFLDPFTTPSHTHPPN
jgi:hypothetical protein